MGFLLRNKQTEHTVSDMGTSWYSQYSRLDILSSLYDVDRIGIAVVFVPSATPAFIAWKFLPALRVPVDCKQTVTLVYSRRTIETYSSCGLFGLGRGEKQHTLQYHKQKSINICHKPSRVSRIWRNALPPDG